MQEGMHMGVYQDEHYKDSIKLESRTPLLLIQSTGSQKCGAEESWGPGERDHFLLHYVVSGEGEYRCGSDVWYLHGGDAFMIYPHTRVEYSANPQEPWEYLWVGFNGFDAPRCVEEIGFTQRQPVLRGRGNSGIRTRMEALYRSYGLGYADRLTMAAKLYDLAAFLVRTAGTRREQQEQRDSAWLAAEYIMLHYREPISIGEVAACASVSQSSLYRHFIDRYHKSPKRFLLEYRIERACELLHEADSTIQEIAAASGFEDAFYFSRVFREVKGISPKEYAARRRHSGASAEKMTAKK